MRAAIINAYGGVDVLEVVADFPVPKITDQQVLVCVHAAGVNPIDWKMREGQFRKVIPKKFPRILGGDISGTVEEVGNTVKGFRVGDEVYGLLDVFRGGGYSEFVPITAFVLCHKPRNLSFQEASAVPLAGMTALQGLRDIGKLRAGQSVLINGAGGGVGTFAVQIAKILGATVTAVASRDKEKLCRSLGADVFIDYAKTPLASVEGKFDLLFDVAATGSFFRCRRLLKRSGRYVDTLPSFGGFALSLATRVLPGPTYHVFMVKAVKKDLELLKEWIETSNLKPVIDRVYPLEKVADAHAYSAQYHAAGKVVLAVK